MPKGFSSSIDLFKDINKFKEEGRQEQVNFIEKQSEISSAAHIEFKVPIPNQRATPGKAPSTGINLKIESNMCSTTINGKEFNHLNDKINEYER